MAGPFAAPLACRQRVGLGQWQLRSMLLSVGIRHHLAWCAEFAQGLLPLVIDAAQPRRDHLSGTLQVFGNADVDKVAAKQLCAEQLLADQPRE